MVSVRVLIGLGINVYLGDKAEWAPLHIAARDRRTAFITPLVWAGVAEVMVWRMMYQRLADASTESISGLQMQFQFAQPECQYSVAVNAPNFFAWTALYRYLALLDSHYVAVCKGRHCKCKKTRIKMTLHCMYCVAREMQQVLKGAWRLTSNEDWME